MTHFAQESDERFPNTDEFEYRGGHAVRHDEFTFVWVPNDPKNDADRKAAFQAAKEEARRKAMSFRNNDQPGAIAVFQDEEGHAIGGLSVRGEDRQDRFSRTMGRRQSELLENITDRGNGHGWCAEQPVTHNVNYVLQRQRRNNVEEELQMFIGRCTITAYTRGCGKKKYRKPIKACRTCQVTNAKYSFHDNASEASESESTEFDFFKKLD